MKVVVIYTYVVQLSHDSAPDLERYQQGAVRFIESYRKFKGDFPHKLTVVSCGAEDPLLSERFPEASQFPVYNGGGWDIGAHQAALLFSGADFGICFNSGAYFSQPGFIEAMVAARKEFGPGVYGASASLENHPHLRTPCWACDPLTFSDYPLVDTRAKCFAAESGPESITAWHRSLGLAAILVTPNGNYAPPDWRGPEMFRNGNQSNTFVRDRHFDWYDRADETLKQTWRKTADGENPNIR